MRFIQLLSIIILTLVLSVSARQSRLYRQLEGGWKLVYGEANGSIDSTKDLIMVFEKDTLITGNEHYLDTLQYDLRDDTLFVYNGPATITIDSDTLIITPCDESGTLVFVSIPLVEPVQKESSEEIAEYPTKILGDWRVIFTVKDQIVTELPNDNSMEYRFNDSTALSYEDGVFESEDPYHIIDDTLEIQDGLVFIRFIDDTLTLNVESPAITLYAVPTEIKIDTSEILFSKQ